MFTSQGRQQNLFYTCELCYVAPECKHGEIKLTLTRRWVMHLSAKAL